VEINGECLKKEKTFRVQRNEEALISLQNKTVFWNGKKKYNAI
jgi:hypothetical protein